MDMDAGRPGPRVAICAAMSTNRVIGRDGRLPWHLPGDLARFRAVTMGQVVVMGRATFDSIGRSLPGRRTIVLTRGEVAPGGAERAGSLGEAMTMTAAVSQCIVAGGQSVFEEALPLASKLYLTLIDAVIEGDRKFPDWSPEHWTVTRSRDHPADREHRHAMRFVDLDRARW